MKGVLLFQFYIGNHKGSADWGTFQRSLLVRGSAGTETGLLSLLSAINHAHPLDGGVGKNEAVGKWGKDILQLSALGGRQAVVSDGCNLSHQARVVMPHHFPVFPLH